MSTEKPAFIASRYQLLDKLGQGGMGVVYKAKDRLINQIVALKQVLLAPADLDFAASHLSADTDLHVALAQEFRTLASLRHPNIISVLDYGFSEKRQPFFTMEYLEASEGLLEAAKGRSIGEKVDLLIQLLQAVAYLHRHKIIHRDLKPDNVVVIGGKVKTLDFGLAQMRRDSAASHTEQLAGTLFYMAPELFDGRAPTRASDLWAVGIMAYELFAAKHPFNTSTLMALIGDLMMKTADVAGLGLPGKLAEIFIRLLEKTPEDRYDDAFEVVDALYQAIGKEPPRETVELRESFIQSAKFVGRQSELQRLTDALENAMTGKGSSLLIGGESGIGKSRLLEELRNHALVKGVTVLHGQGVDGGGLPFQLWRDVMRRMVLAINLTDLQKQILKEIVPDIGVLIGEEVPDAPQLEGKAGSERLTFTIVDVFKSYNKPTMLILEDLQWTLESLEPLKHLMRFVQELPLLIVGSYRNDERPDLPENLSAMAVITLRRLDENGIAELSESMLGAVGKQPHLLDVLKRETEGNCFFIVEVVRALAEEAGRLTDIGRTNLPDHILAGGIDQVIRRRLDRIPVWGQDLLKLTAVAGRQLDFKVIRHIVEQHTEMLSTEHSVNDWLTACATCAVLEVQDQQWRFAHDKLRETILQDSSHDQIPQLHRHVAEAIEAVYPENADYNEILLEHWHQVGDVDRELHYLNPVAEHLVNIVADYEHAHELLERGLQQLPKDDTRQILLWNWGARSHISQGNYDRTQVLAQQARELAELANDQRGIATSLNTLGEVAYRQSDYEKAQGHYQQSLAISQAIGEQHGIAVDLNGLGLVAHDQGDYEKAQDYYQQSLTVHQAMGDQRGSAGRLNNLGLVAYSQGDYEKAQDYYQQSLVIRQQIGDQRGIAMSLNNLGNVALNQGDYEKAQNYYQQSLVIDQAIGNQMGIANSVGNLGLVAYSQGDYEKAQNYYQQSLAIFQAIGDQMGIVFTFNYLGFVHLRMQHDQTQGTFHKALTMALSIQAIPAILEILVGFAWLHLQQGDPTRAGELAGLSQYHPAKNSEVQLSLNTLLPQLDAALSPDDLQAAMERGKVLDLDAVVQEILIMFGSDDR